MKSYDEEILVTPSILQNFQSNLPLRKTSTLTDTISGQQIVRLPDGRLQLITLAQQAGQAAASSVQPASTPSSPLTAVRTLQGQPAVAPSQTVLVSSTQAQPVISPASSPASTPQTKVIIPSQGITSLPGLSSGAVAVMSSPQGVQGTGTINVISSGGQTVAKIISPTAIKGEK